MIQARHLVISDLKPKCPNVKSSQLNPSLPRICFSLCKTLSDLAESFRHNHFNLHVTSHGRLRSSTVAVKVLLCFLTMSCIDLMLSQIPTISSYFLSALVKETEPARIPQMVKAKIFFLEINFIMIHCPQVSSLYIPQGSDRGALSKQIEGGLIAILFFLKHSDF